MLDRLDEAAVQAVYRALGVERFASGGPGHWLVSSPLRDDAHPSFTIRKADGVWCDLSTNEGGGIFDAVMQARGVAFPEALTFVGDIVGVRGGASLTIGKPPAGRGQIVATYGYVDEAGALLYQAVRYAPKGFSQRRPNGRGGWVKNLQGVRLVLYRLPEIVAADPARRVVVAEGEKDADRLAGLGIVATTCAMGAGKWRAEYSETLAGRQVRYVPDNDDAGRKHAGQVARSLAGVAASVRVVTLPNLPEKGDVSDWLDAGGTAGALADLCDVAPEWTPTETPAIAAGGRDADPPAIPYRATPGGLIWDKPGREGVTIPTRLTTFTARIVADVTEDDGADKRRLLELEGEIGGRGAPLRFTIPAATFGAMNWPVEQLGASAILLPGFGARDRARAAIQLLSGDIPARHVYAQTGWRTIGEARLYLHAGGAIGAAGATADVDVALGGALEGYTLPDPPTGEALAVAIRASLRALEVAPPEIMYPVPWPRHTGPLSRAGGCVRLSGWAYRRRENTGRRALSATLRASDDRQPSSRIVGLDGQRARGSGAQRGGRATCRGRLHAERARRRRQPAASTRRSATARRRESVGPKPHASRPVSRAARPPRGLILSTGEDVPRGQSLRARMLILEIGPADLRWERLTGRQQDAEAGRYAEAMAGYVQWLATTYGGNAGRPASYRAEWLELRQGRPTAGRASIGGRRTQWPRWLSAGVTGCAMRCPPGR